MKKLFYILTMITFVIVFLSCGDDSTKPKDDIVLELLATKFYPAFNATEVSYDTDIEITFNANVQHTAGNISIYESNGPVLHESYSVSEDVIFEKNKIIIKPKKDLKGNTSYFVIIDPMSIQTSYGISYAGININNYWTFTTAEAPIDTTENVMTADLNVSALGSFNFRPVADSVHFFESTNPSRYNLSANHVRLYNGLDIIINVKFPTNLELNKPSSDNCEIQLVLLTPIDCQTVEVTLIGKKGKEYEGTFKGSFSFSGSTGEIKNGYFKVDLE